MRAKVLLHVGNFTEYSARLILFISLSAHLAISAKALYAISQDVPSSHSFAALYMQYLL